MAKTEEKAVTPEVSQEIELTAKPNETVTETPQLSDENKNYDASKSKFQKEAEIIFRVHLHSKELHFCADGTAFFELHPAKSYAAKLKDTEVVTINRNSNN